MNKEEVKDRLRGQWDPVLLALSAIPARCLDKQHQPCPKCGGTKRFNYERKDGNGGIYCNDCKPDGTGDGFGTLEWFNGWDFAKAIREVEQHIKPQSSQLPANVRKLRNDVYCRIGAICKLSQKYRDDLVRRGLSEAEIDHRGYWSIERTATLAMLGAFPNTSEQQEIAKNVPGVFPGNALRFAADHCLMLPVRDEFGNVIAMQWRPNEIRPGDPKYRWLSTKSLSSGSPVHHALAPIGKWFDGQTVRITEGPLKADIATALSGVQSIAIAGVSNWRAAAAAAEAIGPARVLLAFDIDRYKNADVAAAIVELYKRLVAGRFEVAIETWDESQKGIDDALARGIEVVALAGDNAEAEIEKLKGIAAAGEKKAAKKSRLKNFKLVKSNSDDPNQAWEKQPLSVPEIAKDLLEMRDNWPKACGNLLFVTTRRNRIRELKQANELFGWIASESPVDFHNRGGCVGKNELFAELAQHVEQYESTEDEPHFPPIEGHYYVKQVEPGDGKHLEQFLDFFTPATDVDRELILAFIATTFWGGEYGRRVAFGVDSSDGTGSGKSELVKRVARLSGGCYDFDTKKIDETELRKKLVNGESHRVVLLDNIKESCVSSSVIESMITADRIGGHKLNFGYTSRPNTLTWAMTMNGMALSRDLAQRTVVIVLNKPHRDGTWEDRIGAFVRDHREKVVADVAAFFQRSPGMLDQFTRWASWEREILARLKNPRAVQQLIRDRTKNADEDHHTSEAISECFAFHLQQLGYNPTEQKIHIPSKVAAEWLTEATGREYSQRSALAQIKNLIDGGSIKNLTRNASNKFGKGWIWNSSSREPVIYDLQEKLDQKKSGW